MKCYNLDGIITELQKSIATKKALLEAWEAVTFPTKKKAAEAVHLWNDSYKANGTYLFSSPAF